MSAPVERISVGGDGAGWLLEAAPERGASLTRIAWAAEDGVWREICRRPDAAEIDDRGASLSKLSSFLMLPFANRIDGARFSFEGRDYQLPLNRPQQACAIHGHSRESVWRVVERSATRLVCEDDFARDDTPYRYCARQVFEADAEAARVTVSVENRGEAAMPFGFGLHPWFPRTPDSRLRFDAAATFAADERTFPTAVEALDGPSDWSVPSAPEERIGLDRGYSGWRGAAEITQPDLGYRVLLSGEGAFGNLHIYVAADRPDFCVEPVSHVTDVVNRRVFAEHGDMARLAPGEALSGSMTLRADAL